MSLLFLVSCYVVIGVVSACGFFAPVQHRWAAHAISLAVAAVLLIMLLATR